jgi:hypothetical protein
MHDGVNLALVFNDFETCRHGWMAFALADGNTDHVVYPSKQAAIDHQPDEFRDAYLHLGKIIGGMPLKDCQLWLDIHRHAYDNRMRLTNPVDLIMPVDRSHVSWQN